MYILFSIGDEVFTPPFVVGIFISFVIIFGFFFADEFMLFSAGTLGDNDAVGG